MGQGVAALAALRAPCAERFQHDHVVSTCAAADILCLQELMSRDAQQFFDRLPLGRFTSQFRDHNRIAFGPPITVRGSGLGIGARSPLTKTLVRAFTGATAGWDRLARKGALYTQLAFRPDLVIDVITVHLQAGPSTRAATIRAAQLADLKAFVDAVGAPGRPFIICGDFNIDGLAYARANSEYRSLRRALDHFEDLGAAADLATFDPHPHGNALAHEFEPNGLARRIDYIFLRPARGPRELRCKGVEIFFDKPLTLRRRDGTAAWASDHYGLSATFECNGENVVSGLFDTD
jgi:endonuclease/exonuclease/phosphatase family metal-dependent hydrolase